MNKYCCDTLEEWLDGCDEYLMFDKGRVYGDMEIYGDNKAPFNFCPFCGYKFKEEGINV